MRVSCVTIALGSAPGTQDECHIKRRGACAHARRVGVSKAATGRLKRFLCKAAKSKSVTTARADTMSHPLMLMLL